MKFLNILLVAFFVSGCFFYKTPVIVNNYSFLIKSNTFKFNDIIMVKQTSNSLSVDTFMLGKSIASFHISKKLGINIICLNNLCKLAKEFNKKFLHHTYPDDFLYNLLSKKEIFNDSFNKKGIAYKQTKNKILFKDKKNKITVVLKKL